MERTRAGHGALGLQLRTGTAGVGGRNRIFEHVSKSNPQGDDHVIFASYKFVDLRRYVVVRNGKQKDHLMATLYRVIHRL